MLVPASSGQMAENLRKQLGQDVSRDQVNYAILRTGIQPIGRAGRVRLFPPGAVATIKEFLRQKRTTSQPQAAAV